MEVTEIIGRLKNNLSSQHIEFTDQDIEKIVEYGFLQNVLLTEDIMQGLPYDVIPEYVWHTSPLEVDRSPKDSGDRMAPVSTTSKLSKSGELLDLPLSELSEMVRSRKVSPVELVQSCLDNIDKYDKRLNAFQLVLGDEALQQAKRAEEDITRGEYKGPIHGIPIAVKDLFALRDHPTTAGSRILQNWVPDYDSAVVERIKSAGGIVIGKTRMSEFAYSPGANNTIYGHTLNPWNNDKDAGGSSSGSGVAVATRMALVGLGSDTGGSIRIPAAHCGIVGLKPTFGRISLFGAVPLSWSLDHGGPLVRYTSDLPLVMALLSGQDKRDPRTSPASEWPYGDKVTNEDTRSLRVGVIGYTGSDDPIGTHDVVTCWMKGVRALEEAGSRVEEVDIPDLERLWVLNGALIGVEAATYHTHWLRTNKEAYSEFARYRLMSAFAYGPNIFMRIQQARALLRSKLNHLWDRFDVITTPVVRHPAPDAGTPSHTLYTGPFNFLGWPALSVPVGVSSEGTPVGMQLVSAPWREDLLLVCSNVVEAALGPLALSGDRESTQ